MTSDRPDSDPAAAGLPGTTVGTSQPEWLLSLTFSAGAAVAVFLAAFGLLYSRVDVALLGIPLMVAAAWAWDGRPSRERPSTMSVDLGTRAEHAELDFRLRVTPVAGVEAFVLRLASYGGKSQQVVVSAATAADLTGRLPVLHSGPQEVLRIDYRMLGLDASLLSLPVEPVYVNRVVPPPYTAISSLPLPRRLQGLTGAHDSARPGDGGDFRDVHPYAPGDRLRRIDWKATARRGKFAGDLYVRRTTATADATVLVVLDSRDDVGEQVAEWSRNTAAHKGIGALDLAREVASSIAAGYSRAGDRVGFQDLASQSRMITHGGGRRHLQRLLRAIELTQPSHERTWTYRRRPPIVTPGALIYILSTFLDDEAARMASLWRGSGHRVIAVDVLPTARFARATRAEQLAHRIVMMERNDRIRYLEAQGVEMLRWHDDGSSAPREARLLALSRPARGGR